MLSRVWLLLGGFVVWAMPQLSWAEGAGGSYKGIATMYYSLIAVVLIYGVNDVFGRKVMYFAAPVIAVGMYFLLPEA